MSGQEEMADFNKSIISIKITGRNKGYPTILSSICQLGVSTVLSLAIEGFQGLTRRVSEDLRSHRDLLHILGISGTRFVLGKCETGLMPTCGILIP